MRIQPTAIGDISEVFAAPMLKVINQSMNDRRNKEVIVQPESKVGLQQACRLCRKISEPEVLVKYAKPNGEKQSSVQEQEAAVAIADLALPSGLKRVGEKCVI